MVCKTRLAERQAAMRLRHMERPAIQIPTAEIQRAVDIYVRALARPPVRAADVTAELVRAGVKFSIAEHARKQLGVVERIYKDEVWLLPKKGNKSK